MSSYVVYGNELYHHGVLGMKWGVRRYQPYRDGERVEGGKEVGAARKVEQRIAKKTAKAERKIARVNRRYERRSDELISENQEMAEKKVGYEDELERATIDSNFYKGESKQLESSINAIDYSTIKNNERINDLFNMLQASGSEAIEARNKAIAKFEKYKNRKLKSISDDAINKGRDYIGEIINGTSRNKSATTDEARALENKLERKANRTTNKIARIEKRDRKKRGYIYDEMGELRNDNEELATERRKLETSKLEADSNAAKQDGDALRLKSYIGTIDRTTRENDEQIAENKRIASEKEEKIRKRLERYKTKKMSKYGLT